MPKPLLNAALGVTLALCSPQALAGESPASTLGFIAGGGQGGDAIRDKSNYYYVYLGAYYETPKFADRKMNAVLGHWRPSFLLSIRPGFLFYPTSGIDNSLTGVGLDRPNVVGSPYI